MRSIQCSIHIQNLPMFKVLVKASDSVKNLLMDFFEGLAIGFGLYIFTNCNLALSDVERKLTIKMEELLIFYFINVR